LLFGHSPQFIIDALKEQLDKGLQIGGHTPLTGEVGKLICELTGVERVAFCNSGTEAVMGALRLARTVTGRDKIALFDGCYHGTFDGIMVRGEVTAGNRLRALPMAPGVPQRIIDDVLLLRYNDPQSIEILKGLRKRYEEHHRVIIPDASLESLAQLRPVFDRRYGSVTAGNSSPLTDGAAAVLLMAEDTAAALGYQPLAFLRSYAVAAVDPGWQLLMGPVFAVPRALERAGLSWSDLGLVEIHEAFAAQVLSNVQAWGSQAWAERLGLPGPVGEVDWERTNVLGGSIAIGHPFGATGARLVTTLAHEMRRRDVQFGLISICAQGGMGYAMVLERT